MINTKQFTDDLFNILSIDSKNNTQLSSKNHHKAFEIILLKYNFINFNNLNDKKLFKSAYELDFKLFPNKIVNNGLYYIEEPFGSQMCPDFILFNVFNNTIIKNLKIELKSGNHKIMWNDGYPQSDIEYLYTDHRLKQSIIINGSQLISSNTAKFIHGILDEIKCMNKKIKNNLPSMSEFKIYIRKANHQIINLKKYNNDDLIDLKKKFIMKINDVIHIPKIKGEKKMSTQPKAISLFSGAGGDTVGLQMAGVDVVGFVEYDNDAIKTHLLNFPNSKLIGTDICEIKDEIFNQYTNKVDILFGGFPCQSFSHGGKKKADDPRGQLYKQFVRATKLIKPKFILGENVKGILTRKTNSDKLFKDEIIKEFNDIGYNMCYKLLNCEKFGVPQLRKRVFFVGVRIDLNIDFGNINLPETNNQENTIRHICEYTLKNALKIEKQKFLDIIPINKCIDSNGSDEIVSGSPPTNLKKCYDEEKNHGLSFKSRSKGTYSGIEDVDSYAHTILCAYNRMPRLFIPMKSGSDIYLRAFTVKELQQIQGFPASYIFHGTEISVIKQIGNAVPPVVVYEVVKYLLEL